MACWPRKTGWWWWCEVGRQEQIGGNRLRPQVEGRPGRWQRRSKLGKGFEDRRGTGEIERRWRKTQTAKLAADEEG